LKLIYRRAEKVNLKRAWRKSRSNIRKRIRRNANIKFEVLRFYHLIHVIKLKEGKYRDVTIKFPKKFCLIANHNETLKFLNNVRKFFIKPQLTNFYIDHFDVEDIGLGASFYFDNLFLRYIDSCKRKRINIRIRGRLSQVKSINHFLLDFGFFVKFRFSNFNSLWVDEDYKDSHLGFRYTGNNRKRFYFTKGCKSLVEHFNKCIKYNGYELTDVLISDLSSSFGEIIGNAEEHAGKKINSWYVRGYYNKIKHEARFMIANFGNSIYHNFKNRSYDFTENNQIIIEKLKKVNNVSNITYEEVLFNYIALQDGISTERTREGGNSNRGQGIMDFLNFLASIIEPTKTNFVVIISGYSKIIIDFKYKFIEIDVKGTKYGKIIFNDSSDLADKMDLSKLILMKENFPGTMVTGSIVIQEKYISK
jgi:hypothetical protein